MCRLPSECGESPLSGLWMDVRSVAGALLGVDAEIATAMKLNTEWSLTSTWFLCSAPGFAKHSFERSLLLTPGGAVLSAPWQWSDEAAVGSSTGAGHRCCRLAVGPLCIDVIQVGGADTISIIWGCYGLTTRWLYY